MDQEIKDILLAIQGSIIKLQEGQNELIKDVSGLKEDVSVLKEDVSCLKQDVSILKQDVAVLQQDVKELKKGQREIVYGIVIPLRDNQNEINDEFRKKLDELKNEIRSINSKNYVQKVI